MKTYKGLILLIFIMSPFGSQAALPLPGIKPLATKICQQIMSKTATALALNQTFYSVGSQHLGIESIELIKVFDAKTPPVADTKNGSGILPLTTLLLQLKVKGEAPIELSFEHTGGGTLLSSGMDFQQFNYVHESGAILMVTTNGNIGAEMIAFEITDQTLKFYTPQSSPNSPTSPSPLSPTQAESNQGMMGICNRAAKANYLQSTSRTAFFSELEDADAGFDQATRQIKLLTLANTRKEFDRINSITDDAFELEPIKSQYYGTTWKGPLLKSLRAFKRVRIGGAYFYISIYANDGAQLNSDISKYQDRVFVSRTNPADWYHKLNFGNDYREKWDIQSGNHSLFVVGEAKTKLWSNFYLNED